MNDKKILSQESGDNNNNYQGQITINHQGLSYKDAKEIAEDVFQTNILQLSQKAKELAKSRAEEITEKFLKELFENHPKSISKLETPGMQYALFSAQREYAKTGDNDLEELLIDILVQRTNHDERSFCQIVLDASLDIIPKLTPDQLDAITLAHFIHQPPPISINTLDKLRNHFKTDFLPFIESLTKEEFRYRHLYFVGCCAMGGGKKIGDAKKLEEIILEQFCPRIFKKPLTTPQNDKEKLLKEIKTFVLSIDSKFEQLFDVWEKSRLQHLKLTSSGTAIALANFRKKTGKVIHLAECIN